MDRPDTLAVVDGITVRLAGPLGVSTGGSPERGPALGSRQARLLLGLLAARRRQLVPTDRIVAALWADLPPQRPDRAVATLVSRLRAALGTSAVLGGPGGYRLGDPPGVRVDLDEAARLTAECRARLARGETALAAAAGRRACALLGEGPALPELAAADWVADLRAEHTTLLRAARLATAEALIPTGDAGAAAALAELAVHADHLDEAARRLLMAALQAAGEPARALIVYEQLRAELAQELGVDPAPETRALHAALLAEARPPDRRPVRTARARLPGAGRRGRPAGRRLVGGRRGPSQPAARHRRGWDRQDALAGELVATVEATGGRVLTARCYAGERSLFLQPFVDALGRGAGGTAAGRAPRAGGAAGRRARRAAARSCTTRSAPRAVERGSASSSVRRAFEAVTAVAARAGGRATDRCCCSTTCTTPGLATVELLHYLARHAGPARLLVAGHASAPRRATTRSSALADVADAARPRARCPPRRCAELAQRRARPSTPTTILRAHPRPPAVRRGDAARAGRRRGQAPGDAAGGRAGPAAPGRARGRGGCCGPARCSARPSTPSVVAGMLDLAAARGRARCERGRRPPGCSSSADRRLRVRQRPGPGGALRDDAGTRSGSPTTGGPPTCRRGIPRSVGRHAAAAGDWPRAARAFLLAGEQALTPVRGRRRRGAADPGARGRRAGRRPELVVPRACWPAATRGTCAGAYPGGAR